MVETAIFPPQRVYTYQTVTRISIVSQFDPHPQRESALSITLDNAPVEEVVSELRIGTDYLGVSTGFLTRITDGTQRIVQSTGDHPLLQPGEECPLEDAYCQQTVKIDGVLSVQDADSSADIADTSIETFGLETYVGAKITVGDELYGTVCFADRDGRADPFTESEELFVELLAERIGKALERESYETELAQRNRQLEAEKQRFEGIADASTDIIFRIDSSAEFTYVSSAVERVLGYDPVELVGTSFIEMSVSTDIEESLELYQRVLAGEMVEGVELKLETAGGERRVFEINAQPFDDGIGGEAGIQGVARDVTERKERRRELEVKDRAMNKAEVGIVIADAAQDDLPVTYVNEKFCDLTGYDRDAVIGTNCRFLQGDGTDQSSVAALREAIMAEESVSVEILNYRASGVAFWNEVTVTPVENAAGETVQFIGFQQDITPRKRREKLLDVMNRVLRHNLRNKMNIVLGGATGATGAGQMVASAAEDVISLADRARDLHAVAQEDRNPERVDLDDVFDGLHQQFADEYPEATVEKVTKTPRDVVAGSEVAAALAEVMRNALVHDPADNTTVTLAAHDDGDEIAVTITDDGPGINQMERAVVESGTESALEHGSGLGLWFVNWVITRYGGSFRVASRDEANGTVATIHLPAASEDDDVLAVARRPTTLNAKAR